HPPGPEAIGPGYGLLAKSDGPNGPNARISFGRSPKMRDSVRRALDRVLALFRRAPLDTGLEAETASQLEAAIEGKLRQGVALEEARRRALVRFGGVARAMEQHREARGLPALDTLRQDLRFSLRMLRRDRGLACIVILVLALGVGANVTVFSVVNTILLR